MENCFTVFFCLTSMLFCVRVCEWSRSENEGKMKTQKNSLWMHCNGTHTKNCALFLPLRQNYRIMWQSLLLGQSCETNVFKFLENKHAIIAKNWSIFCAASSSASVAANHRMYLQFVKIVLCMRNLCFYLSRYLQIYFFSNASHIAHMAHYASCLTCTSAVHIWRNDRFLGMPVLYECHFTIKLAHHIYSQCYECEISKDFLHHVHSHNCRQG